MMTVKQWYKRERAKGWRASQALHNANIRNQWEQRDDVRLLTEPDCSPYDDSYIDTWGDSAEKVTKVRKELWDRIEREGVCGIVGQYFDGSDWVTSDNCWGFIGDDWQDSGYDIDVMAMTMASADEVARAKLLQGAV
jgi:hypothetical protein